MDWPLAKARRRLAPLRIDIINQQDPASGIVHIQVRGRGAFRADDVAKLRIDGEIVFECPAAGDNRPRGEAILMDIGVHSALLQDGSHSVLAELHRAGVVRESARTTLTTRCNGPIAEMARDAMRAAGTPLVVRNGEFDSSLYPYDADGAQCWLDRPDAPERIESMHRGGTITDDEALLLKRFIEQGYLVLEGLIPADAIARVNTEIDDAVASGWEGYVYGSSQRITQLHRKYPQIRKLWQSDVYLRWVRLIFGDEALPCQSLTYLFGSQQDAHQDTIHLTPFPAGAMCGVWIALEDIQPDSGELVVYPGSHKLERVYMRSLGCPKVTGSDWSTFGKTVVPHWGNLIARNGLKPEIYRPKAGSVLIWHENLLHAGSYRNDQSLTRRSIVFHCFAQGAVAYYDSTGVIGYTFRPQ